MLALPIFWAIDALLKQEWLARRFFDEFRKPESLRKTLLVRVRVCGFVQGRTGENVSPPD
jgi:hypothetical protein